MVVDSSDNLDCTEQSKTVLVKIVNKSSVFQSMTEIEKKSIYITVKKLIYTIRLSVNVYSKVLKIEMSKIERIFSMHPVICKITYTTNYNSFG